MLGSKGAVGSPPAPQVLVLHGKTQMLKGSHAVLPHVLDILPVREFPSVWVREGVVQIVLRDVVNGNGLAVGFDFPWFCDLLLLSAWNGKIKAAVAKTL